MDDEAEVRGPVEDRIQKAISTGAFDNLPGKGKPLKIEQQTFVEPTMRLAYRLLRNAGMTPAWLEKQKDLRCEIEQVRTDLRRSVAHANVHQLQALRSDFWDECERINKTIRMVNLEAPAASLHLMAVNPEREWKRGMESIGIRKDQS